MKIAVCVKQVPQLDQVRCDKRNRIVREDVELIGWGRSVCGQECSPIAGQFLRQALDREAVGRSELATTF